MLLYTLLARLDEPLDLAGVPDVEVGSVHEDSRRIGPGDLFIARQGQGVDGKQFALAAARAGAVAIVSDGKIAISTVPVIVVRDPASAAGVLANAAAGDPSRHMKLIGITGTNGKTTTSFLLRHILSGAGIPCGLIGTCEIDDGREVRPADMTTPGPTDLALLLARMRANGCRAVAMEVSSHGLAQGRVAGVHFSAAGFTNLTGDHLDYHKTMECYAAAKGQLFKMLEESSVAVVNSEDQWSDRVLGACRGRLVDFGIGAVRSGRFAPVRRGSTSYIAQDAVVTAQGSTFTLQAPGAAVEVVMGLIGRHNIQNALCAGAIALEAFNVALEDVATALSSAAGAPGRLQRVDAGQPFTVLVDYAHTDDALENVLSALRPITRGKLRVVFGCGGDRDRTKRPRMAAVAQKWADAVYITSDNPRTEDPAAIVREIVAGLTVKPALVELDRRSAIQQAIADAADADVVLIAGKGHENYQIVGTTRHPFDDVEEARRAIGIPLAA